MWFIEWINSLNNSKINDFSLKTICQSPSKFILKLIDIELQAIRNSKVIVWTFKAFRWWVMLMIRFRFYHCTNISKRCTSRVKSECLACDSCDSLWQLVISVLPVLLRASGGQGSEPGHEEVEAREGDHVDRQLPQVSVELAGEPETGGHAWTNAEWMRLSETILWLSRTQGQEIDSSIYVTTSLRFLEFLLALIAMNAASPDMVRDTRWLRSP